MRNIFTIAVLTLSINIYAQIPSNGLVGYWPFNGNANDISGNNLNGNVNGATLTTDRFGNSNSAYNFNGTDNYIIVDDNSLIDFTNNLSVCVWYYASDSLTSGSILGKARGTNLSGLAVQAFSPHTLFALNNGPSNIGCDTVSYKFYKGWHFLTGTYDGSVLKLYIDGIKINSKITSLSLLNSSRALYFGSEDYLWRFFSGKIDDIRLYNRALTSEEVVNLFKEGLCFQTITVTDTLIINVNLSGFKPVTYNNSIKVYPNPTNNLITIDCGANYNILNGYTIKIMNSLSQFVYSSIINKQFTTIDLNSWTGNGVYFVHLIDASNNIIEIKKIVLQ